MDLFKKIINLFFKPKKEFTKEDYERLMKKIDNYGKEE